MLRPERCRESVGGGTHNGDGLWTPVVVATLNQGDKVLPQGNQSSQGVGHVVAPKLEAQTSAGSWGARVTEDVMHPACKGLDGVVGGAGAVLVDALVFECGESRVVLGLSRVMGCEPQWWWQQ